MIANVKAPPFSWPCCLFFLLLWMVASLSGCRSDSTGKKYRIGFSQCGEADNWRRSMIGEMHRELAFHPQMELIYKQADDSSQLQIQQVREMLADGIDLLIISPNEARPLTPVVEEGFNKGIPVIVVDRKIASSLYTNYIGADNFGIGRMAGDYAAALLNGKGNIIEIEGLPASSPAMERSRGFSEALKAFPGIHLNANLNGGWIKPKAREALGGMGTQLTHADLIFAHNDVMALGAYEECQSRGITQVRIIGVDALPGKGAGMEFVADKILTASLLYPTGGTEAIRNAAKILSGLPLEKETSLQTLVVDSTNVRMMSLQTNKILSQQKDIERQQQTLSEQTRVYNTQRNLLYAVGAALALTVFFAGLLFYSRILNRRINRQLAQKNEEVFRKSEALQEMSVKADLAHEAKLNFFTNISHEFRTPLTLIIGPVDELIAHPKLPLSGRQSLQIVRKNAMRLLKLVNQLIDFRKIEFHKMQVRASETDMVAFINEIILAFQPIAHKRNIDCRLITTERSLPAWIDIGMFDKIIFNLLSNAFKFTPDDGFITLTLEKNAVNSHLQLSIEDNGIGMSKVEMDQAFDVFYQGDISSHKGSGLGLPLTKELILLHHGTIGVSSQKNKGSIFTVSIPLGKTHFSAEEVTTEPVTPDANNMDHQLYTMDLLPVNMADEAVPDQGIKQGSLLIIEDNPEMRRFIRQHFSAHFYIMEADNGIAGLQQVFEHIPDVIICDVTMPGKDGITLTNQVKKDIRTSHIPIILLTARTSEEHKLEGLRSAADAYITKPFQMPMLEQVIGNVLLNRNKLKEHYSAEVPGELSSTSVKKTDRKFIAEFAALVEQNISNDQFSIDDMCKSLGLSKVQLYRKVKALLNSNINEYLLNARIQKAKYYLRHEELSVAEVADKTGFSSPAYFSTVFKAKSGFTPKNFRDKRTNGREL